MHEKLENLQAILREQQVDCLALIPGPNFRYMTGLELHLMERPTVGFFPAEGEPAFVLPGLERSRFEQAVSFEAQAFTYEDGESPQDAFRRAMMALPEIQRIAVEHLQMRVLELKLVQRHVPTAFMLNADPLMDQLRLIKHPDEIARIREAIAISEAALGDVLPDIRPGMSERDIANRLLVAQLNRGGGPVPFEPLVQSGPNAADPHGTPGDRLVQSGEMLLIDFGTTNGGYASDITRTFMVGEKPSDRFRAVYEAVKAANAAGRAAAKPGVPCREVDQAARAVIDQAGFGDYFIHRTGHGLGLGAHESPSVDSSNQTPLEAGMVFTVEPGIYIPGEIGVRIEDDVLITDDGSESLTTYTRDLTVIGVG
jgi:Xaa-Pro dipeptidase